MISIALIVMFSLIGSITGVLTGLIPGFHVNNVALIFLSFYGVMVSLLGSLFTNVSIIAVLLSVILISAALSHTFVNIIPATFIGAPDDDVALAILPAHRMLLDGEGYEAIALSALGSFGAVILSMIFLIPFKILMSKPIGLYGIMKENMVWILLAISVIMILTEKSKRKNIIKEHLKSIIFAMFIFLLSGLFGYITFNLSVRSPVGLTSSILFPALVGMFGLSTIISSLQSSTFPTKDQRIKEPRIRNSTKSMISVITGTISGAFVAIVPGATSATGTIIAMTARGETNTRQTIITLSAVNTACMIFVSAALFIIMRARSGVALVISNIIPIPEWTSILPPENFIYFLMAIVISAAFSYPFTCIVGKTLAKRFSSIPYSHMLKITIILITFLVFIFTGIVGLIILFTGASIGLLPIYLGIRRSNCMGILLLPLILNYII